MQKLRICFAGTPDFSATHLLAVLESSHEIIAVYTQPDRPSGRGKKLHASPVKEIAERYSIPVYQPISLRSDEQEKILLGLNPDLMAVVAYGLILPKPILQIPKYGCLNVHASLLPRWRGAAPIERALLAGDTESGVTVMQMDEGLDTGDILLREKVSIEESDSRVDLEQKLCVVGKRALVHALDNLLDIQSKAVKQEDSESTYARKLEKSEALIEWNNTAEQVSRQVRAGIGRYPAYSFIDGQRLRILDVAPLAISESRQPGNIVSVSKDSFTVSCSNSSIRVNAVQLPGKKPMAVRDVMNSRPTLFQSGSQFSAATTQGE